MSKNFFALLISIIVITSITSCTKSGDKQGSSKNIFITNNQDEIEFADPRLATGVPDHRVLLALFEGLVIEDPKDLHPIPGVAKSWTISGDKKTYTFTLRNDAKWSDGKIVTAHDFVYSWKSVMTATTGSRYAHQVFYIKNAEKFYKGVMKDFSKVGLKAPDDFTLVVELETPTPFFLHLLAHNTLMPVRQDVVEKHGDNWTRPENIVSNGAFKMTEWEPSQKLVAMKNPHYWDAKNVKLDGVIYYPVQHQNTAFKMYEAGDVHWLASEPPADRIPHLKGRADFRIDPYFGTYFYWFNVTREPFNDKRVRKALSLAINRQQITDKVIFKATPASTLVPSYLADFGYTSPNNGPDRNIVEAKRLLAEAGYPNGKGFPKFDIHYNTRDDHKKIALAIQQMWKTNLGIENVGLRNEEWKVYLKTQNILDHEITRQGWIGDYLDPQTFLELCMTNNGNNNSGWSNAKFDALVRKAMATTDNQQRFAIMKQAEAIVLDELPMLPVFNYAFAQLVKPEVKGFYANLLNHHNPKFIYLEETKKVATR